MDELREWGGKRYDEIARVLREELVSGRYGPEGRMPSEAQLVNRFKVSRPTVARALRILQEEGLVERRAGAGTFVKQRESSVRSRASRVLALLMPDLGNTEIFQLIGGEIASLARVNDYTLAWDGFSDPKVDPEASRKHTEQLCREYIERGVSGVFFAPCELVAEKESANRDMAVMLREAGIAVTLLDRDVTSFPLRSDFDLVGLDNLMGSFLMAEHLIKLGCKSLHFVARRYSAPTIEERIAGMFEALRRHKIAGGVESVRIGNLGDKRYLRSLVTPPFPDAFMCANDHTAALLLRALYQAGVRVPSQVRVVGFDDVKFATLVSPSLTTVQQPWREIAALAFRVMLDRLADPTLPARHVTAAPRMVVRDSCGAYAASIAD